MVYQKRFNNFIKSKIKLSINARASMEDTTVSINKEIDTSLYREHKDKYKVIDVLCVTMKLNNTVLREPNKGSERKQMPIIITVTPNKLDDGATLD